MNLFIDFYNVDEIAAFERLAKTGNVAKTRKEVSTSTSCSSF